MSFRDFRYPDILKKFNLTRREELNYFAACPPIQPHDSVLNMLRWGVPLASAISTEKARSEMIVTPLLMALKLHARQVSLFSGVDFSVDPDSGLSGVCDFLLSRSPEQLVVTAPVVAVVEAKNESIRDGMGQCIAEMVAAQVFNGREDNAIGAVYGAVTTGTSWRFLSLSERVLVIDLNEYLISQPERILGILLAMVTGQVQSAAVSAPE